MSTPYCEPTAEGFADFIAGCFEAAVGQCGLVAHSYRIAGRIVRLEFAGPGLVPLMTPALSLAEVDGRLPADLTLRSFDSETTGVAMPAPPWSWDGYTASGEIAGFTTDTVRLAFQLSAGAVNVYRRADRIGYYWTPTPTRITVHDAGAPFLFLFHWWLADCGLQLVHGAGVGNERGGVMLAGRGGAGKSSTALACLSVGARYVGDDYCILDLADGPFLHRLYGTAKADGATLARLSGLAQERLDLPCRGTGKAVLALAGHYDSQIVEHLPIDAILLPEVASGEETTIAPTSRLSALRAIGPSTMMQLPGTNGQSWKLMSRLAATVPAHELVLGTDVAGIMRAVSGAIATAPGRSP